MSNSRPPKNSGEGIPISFLNRIKQAIRPKKPVEEKRYKTADEIVLPPVPQELQVKFRQVLAQLEHMQSFPLDLLARLYGFMDEYNRFVATFAVCEKGCSACCEIPVNVSRLEAEYIHRKTGHAIHNNIIAKNGHSPCPFLAEGGNCSIYQHRPYNCRTFHTLDNPKYCSTGEDHAVYGVSSVGYGSDILADLAAVIRQVNNGEYHDIRVYFQAS